MAEVALKGRGAIGNPKNRFETLEVERDEEVPGPERSARLIPGPRIPEAEIV
jgi:hypothetical protein